MQRGFGLLYLAHQAEQEERIKVHVIEADMTGVWQDAVEKRDALGRGIARLAARVNEPVWFHDFKEPVAGAPVIMLECSDAFLAEVKKLPGFVQSHDLWPGAKTVRAPALRQYFSQAQKPPRRLRPPQP